PSSGCPFDRRYFEQCPWPFFFGCSWWATIHGDDGPLVCRPIVFEWVTDNVDWQSHGCFAHLSDCCSVIELVVCLQYCQVFFCVYRNSCGRYARHLSMCVHIDR